MSRRFSIGFAACAIVLSAVSCGGDAETSGSGGAGSGATTASSGDATSGSGGGAATSTGAGGETSSAYNTLWIPEAIEGTTFNLQLNKSSKQLREGAATDTYGYNGSEFWGPTLIMNAGDLVQMNVTNNLDEDTTTHWHGFHIPAMMDGGPHQMIPAGTTWSPSFQVMNQAATYWYHPHLHMKTMEQLAMGAGGLIIIRDAEEAALALPRSYGVDDIPLVLTSRSFDADNQLNVGAVYGDYALANGTLNAEVSLPAQLVRLRVLNAEIERAYNLGFSDDRTFYLIATDGGLVNAPVALTRLPLYVGERAEILVDLSGSTAGDSLDLQAFNGGQTFGFPGGEPNQTGEFGSLLNDKTFDVLHIVVGAPTPDGVTALPVTLANNTYWTAADATTSRTITVTENGPGTPFNFDNTPYDMSVINQTVTLGATEMWTIQNSEVFSHSFHIHDVQFKIVTRSSGPVPSYEQGWKDTLSLFKGESVSFVARFDDFASDTDPYMYHCHFSNHEDEGMMAQFLVK